MKIKRSQLKQIIKEEIKRTLVEHERSDNEVHFHWTDSPAGHRQAQADARVRGRALASGQIFPPGQGGGNRQTYQDIIDDNLRAIARGETDLPSPGYTDISQVPFSVAPPGAPLLPEMPSPPTVGAPPGRSRLSRIGNRASRSPAGRPWVRSISGHQEDHPYAHSLEREHEALRAHPYAYEQTYDIGADQADIFRGRPDEPTSDISAGAMQHESSWPVYGDWEDRGVVMRGSQDPHRAGMMQSYPDLARDPDYIGTIPSVYDPMGTSYRDLPSTYQDIPTERLPGHFGAAPENPGWSYAGEVSARHSGNRGLPYMSEPAPSILQRTQGIAQAMADREEEERSVASIHPETLAKAQDIVGGGSGNVLDIVRDIHARQRELPAETPPSAVSIREFVEDLIK